TGCTPERSTRRMRMVCRGSRCTSRSLRARSSSLSFRGSLFGCGFSLDVGCGSSQGAEAQAEQVLLRVEDQAVGVTGRAILFDLADAVGAGRRRGRGVLVGAAVAQRDNRPVRRAKPVRAQVVGASHPTVGGGAVHPGRDVHRLPQFDIERLLMILRDAPVALVVELVPQLFRNLAVDGLQSRRSGLPGYGDGVERGFGDAQL